MIAIVFWKTRVITILRAIIAWWRIVVVAVVLPVMIPVAHIVVLMMGVVRIAVSIARAIVVWIIVERVMTVISKNFFWYNSKEN